MSLDTRIGWRGPRYLCWDVHPWTTGSCDIWVTRESPGIIQATAGFGATVDVRNSAQPATPFTSKHGKIKKIINHKALHTSSTALALLKMADSSTKTQQCSSQNTSGTKLAPTVSTAPAALPPRDDPSHRCGGSPDRCGALRRPTPSTRRPLHPSHPRRRPWAINSCRFVAPVGSHGMTRQQQQQQQQPIHGDA